MRCLASCPLHSSDFPYGGKKKKQPIHNSSSWPELIFVSRLLAGSKGKIDKSLLHLLDASSCYPPVFLWPERVVCLSAPSFNVRLIVTLILTVLETYQSFLFEDSNLVFSIEVKMIPVKLLVIWAEPFPPTPPLITLLSEI